MPDCEFRWCKEYAFQKVFASMAGWFAILLLPSGFAYIISMDKPHEKWVIAGIVGVFLVCVTLHSMKYWRRFSDRSVQIAFRPGGIWAKQLQGRDIPWGEVLEIQGLEKKISRDLAIIYLRTMGGEVRLDFTGLDSPLTLGCGRSRRGVRLRRDLHDTFPRTLEPAAWNCCSGCHFFVSKSRRYAPESISMSQCLPSVEAETRRVVSSTS
jgi:hypothetical protein